MINIPTSEINSPLSSKFQNSAKNISFSKISNKNIKINKTKQAELNNAK